jgi:hypothetical protein
VILRTTSTEFIIIKSNYFQNAQKGECFLDDFEALVREIDVRGCLLPPRNVFLKVASSKELFVHQGQKVHLFCSNLNYVAEAQPRLDNRRGQKALFDRGHIQFFRRPHELQSKRHHWKNNLQIILYPPFSKRYIY